MKNVRKFILNFSVALILLVGVVGCEGWGEEKEKVQLVKKPEEIIISLEQAKTMYDSYTMRRKPLIQKFEDSIDFKIDYNPKNQQIQNQQKEEKSRQADINQGESRKFKVARYGDFDYKTLKQYLAYIEQEAKSAGIDDISTLRLYFANYPNQSKFEEGRSVKDPRRNTFILIPTLNRKGKNYAFFTTDNEKGGRKPLVLNDNFETMEKHETGFFDYHSNQSNEASLAPNFLFPNRPLIQSGIRSTAGNHVGLNPPSVQ